MKSSNYFFPYKIFVSAIGALFTLNSCGGCSNTEYDEEGNQEELLGSELSYSESFDSPEETVLNYISAVKQLFQTFEIDRDGSREDAEANRDDAVEKIKQCYYNEYASDSDILHQLGITFGYGVMDFLHPFAANLTENGESLDYPSPYDTVSIAKVDIYKEDQYATLYLYDISNADIEIFHLRKGDEGWKLNTAKVSNKEEVTKNQLRYELKVYKNKESYQIYRDANSNEHFYRSGTDIKKGIENDEIGLKSDGNLYYKNYYPNNDSNEYN